MEPRKSRRVRIGGVDMGGGAGITVQTMTRSRVEEVEGSLAEIRAAAASGADLVRLAVPNPAAAGYFGRIAARSPLPLVADTHFDWRTTLAAIREGAAKVRVNPGNMDPDGLARVAEAAGVRGIPIRVGGNSGSVRRSGEGADSPLSELLAQETLTWAARLEELGFRDTVISVKASEAAVTVRAYRLVAAQSDYPLHLGLTAAGPRESSLLKSAAAIGSLLLDGIGDSIRFSFTGDAAGEVAAGRDLLRALALRREGVEIISCPACGRSRVELPELVREAREALGHIRSPLRVAIMGCEVNGPGEAGDADLGLAPGGGAVHLFIRGRVVEKLPPDRAIARLAEEAERLGGESR